MRAHVELRSLASTARRRVGYEEVDWLGEPSDPRFLEAARSEALNGGVSRSCPNGVAASHGSSRSDRLSSSIRRPTHRQGTRSYRVLPGGADWETNDILPVQILKIYRFGRWKRAGFWLDPRSISARSASVLRGFAGGRGALRPFAAQQGADDDGCGGQQTRRSEPHRPIPIQNSGGYMVMSSES